jgi:hypothetical protein
MAITKETQIGKIEVVGKYAYATFKAEQEDL